MPIEFIRKINKDITLGLWKITEDIDFFLSELLLTEREDERLKIFANENRKKQWLAYRILIDRLINKNLHNEIEYDENGKPFLKNSKFKISVAHTENYAAVIISKTSCVGIDIEKITQRILKVKHKFLSENEIKFSEKENSIECYYIFWCSKESMYKLYGKRNLDFKKNLLIEKFIISEKGNTKGTIITDDVDIKVKLFYEIFDEHVIVYAID